MKDQAHHLKHLQKKVLRSARRNVESEKFTERTESNQSANQSNSKAVIYDEVVTSDQQVPRAPTRMTYH